MNITKTVTLKGKRELTIPLENYEAHREVVDHWIGGGEVEHCPEQLADSFIGFTLLGSPTFQGEGVYRIKHREPQPGEVWLLQGVTPCIVRLHKNHIFVDLNGSQTYHKDYGLSKVYAAPSVQAWVAREIIKESGCDTTMPATGAVSTVVFEMAREGE